MLLGGGEDIRAVLYVTELAVLESRTRMSRTARAKLSGPKWEG